jgi:hypothetical protein
MNQSPISKPASKKSFNENPIRELTSTERLKLSISIALIILLMVIAYKLFRGLTSTAVYDQISIGFTKLGNMFTEDVFSRVVESPADTISSVSQ